MIVDQILIDPWVWIEIGTPQKTGWLKNMTGPSMVLWKKSCTN
jgi:hypothetical protein